jgi:hypothetical protein
MPTLRKKQIYFAPGLLQAIGRLLNRYTVAKATVSLEPGNALSKSA